MTTHKALVCYEPNPDPIWKLEYIKIKAGLGPHQLKIRMVATGLCHTDLDVAKYPTDFRGAHYPRVLGHEGAGIVEQVGSDVKIVQVGDPVLLSYSYCKTCQLCKTGQQPYCEKWGLLNLFGVDGVFESSQGKDTAGGYFGQSSFSSVTIASENSVVNMKGLIRDNDELKLMAPLGCGLLTGCGAVMNTLKLGTEDIVLITGLGAVGMGAVMASKIAGCKEIIVVDRIESRLNLARELGATKIINAGQGNVNIAEAARKAVDDQRIGYVVEATGVTPVILAALEAMGKRGRLLQIGAPGPDSKITIPLGDFFLGNKIFECHFLGDTTPQEMIPRMFRWYRDGKFPVEKLVRTFPADDGLKALEAMTKGEVIKPVIVW